MDNWIVNYTKLFKSGISVAMKLFSSKEYIEVTSLTWIV